MSKYTSLDLAIILHSLESRRTELRSIVRNEHNTEFYQERITEISTIIDKIKFDLK